MHITPTTTFADREHYFAALRSRRTSTPAPVNHNNINIDDVRNIIIIYTRKHAHAPI